MAPAAQAEQSVLMKVDETTFGNRKRPTLVSKLVSYFLY